MCNRKSIRPSVDTIDYDKSMTATELFQSKTLRPILKLQNALLKLYFLAHLSNLNVDWYSKTIEQKETYLKTLFEKDNRLREGLIHLVIGQFTTEEFEIYHLHTRDLNKRIKTMLFSRLLDQLVK